MSFKTIEKYSGSAKKYILEFVFQNLPGSSAILEAHQNLESYVERNTNYIIRKTSDHSLRGQWKKGVGDGFKFIISDNEPAVWSYMQTVSGDIPNFEKEIAQQGFPIAFAMNKDERAEAKWTKCGRSLPHREFSNIGLKHCHIAPCSPRGAPLSTQEDFKKRMLALLSPMNHFLFPGPRRHTMHKDWGEDKYFIELLCYLLGKSFYTIEQSVVFKKFLAQQGVQLLAQEPKDFEISYVPKVANETIEFYKYEGVADLKAFIDSSDAFYAINKNTAGTACAYPTFIETLRNWLEYTDHETICNEDYSFGGKGWLYCKVGNEVLRLNQDTRRAGVKAFLDSLGPGNVQSSSLVVVANQGGRFNVVVPNSIGHGIPYFYFYLHDGFRNRAEPL